jgi:hypothetical protein
VYVGQFTRLCSSSWSVSKIRPLLMKERILFELLLLLAVQETV